MLIFEDGMAGCISAWCLGTNGAYSAATNVAPEVTELQMKE
jgi:hypothetical protein